MLLLSTKMTNTDLVSTDVVTAADAINIYYIY
jgi:hypothetical protein